MLHFERFYMEDPLEAGRFAARFNALESGGPPETLGSLLDLIGNDRESLLAELAACSLRDSPNHGRNDLRDHIARLHPGATRDEVLVTTGTSEALLLALLVLKPRRVALLVPGFQLLTELVHAVGGEVVPLSMRWNEHGHPKADVEAWGAKILMERPDLVMINHPHNPSGLVLSRHELDHLAQAARRAGASVLGDEHYRFLTNTEPLGTTLWQPPSRAMGRDVAGCTLVTGSFIKCLGVPGLRIGWCVAPRPLVAAAQNIKNYTTHTVNPLSEWLAERLLRDATLGTFGKARNLWKTNQRQCTEWLAHEGGASGWLGAAPEGGWVTCLTHRALPEHRGHLDEALERAGCAMLDLNLFEWKRYGNPACLITRNGGLRVGLGMPAHSLCEFLKELTVIGQSLVQASPTAKRGAVAR